FSIARNAMRDFRKRAAFRREVLGDVPETFSPELAFPENGGKDDTLQNPDNIWLARLLRQLTEEEYNLLMMRYQMNFSNLEVAEALDINKSAVSKRYSRLLEKLRELEREIRDESG
ncbi:MAG: sigma-70 family RNA polymerase sigma factor, partial [Schwartzia sp.]|nr:sigma-70 family RNA polymerase sigma factor [Schwartzia sp. (in: firmicutes)]